MSQRIWVLGAGQLGAMLKHAGMPLALDVCPVDINESSAPALAVDDLVTAEREQWPATLVTHALAQHPRFINQNVFGRLADRKTQKELIDSLGIATAPWRNVANDITANELRDQLGERVLLKRRTGGYDGRGQHWLRTDDDEVPGDWQGEAIAEQAINFDEEVSLVGVRNAAGECVFYPLTLNLHLSGILYASVAPLARLQPLQAQAEQMLGNILNALDYVGVMAMETFRVGDQLLINELAPRVHNSGHWTQAGASISQFEYHLRAIADMAIPAPQVIGQNVMINLIGIDYNPQWRNLPCARTYWYGKEVRPGRKVGHINIVSNNITEVRETLVLLGDLLPEHYYRDAIDWSLSALESL
ncbi:5-(carboxyamino)imidazole ribonucleotide synthase [Cellvibrio sp. PSBB023]|uniref:5-(carboxyamino)imidazole ribonucleotide synthase n=1 Tax=Cellvibrio sp. PSBB023 TaxID=1945512 RepID=UPI00098F03AB|nr:5-(carboxyamino)imidazole ribonucleotide synthase [Cellvibrio sp. PSBB023]AQT60319.1 5-(carboxyamino)imidazole ribonucleotide synthase [Cellvibrio sp. PSBB023]